MMIHDEMYFVSLAVSPRDPPSTIHDPSKAFIISPLILK